MCPGRIHVTKFGGSPKWEYHLGKSADAHLKVAETTVMEFGEYNTLKFFLKMYLWGGSAFVGRQNKQNLLLFGGEIKNFPLKKTLHTLYITLYCLLTDTLYTYHSSRNSLIVT